MDSDLDFDVNNPLHRHRQFYHVGVACHRLEAAMDKVGQLFGLTWTPIADETAPNLFNAHGPSDAAARRTHSLGSPVPFELLEGNPGSTWDTPKDVVTHHLAYWSEDVGADVHWLQEAGWTVELVVLDDHGNPTEFAYMVKPGSVRIELVDVRRRPAYLALIGHHPRAD
jgi:hypothetical protein